LPASANGPGSGRQRLDYEQMFSFRPTRLLTCHSWGREAPGTKLSPLLL